MENVTNIHNTTYTTPRPRSDLNKHKVSLEEVVIEVITCIGAVSILINLLLVFVIIKFKKLRQDSTNWIFLQVNIIQALFCITLIWLIWFQDFSFEDKSGNYFCVLYEVNTYVAVVLGALFFFLICDSQIKLYHPEWYQKSIRSYKYVFIVFYIFICVLSGLTAPFCMIQLMIASTPAALLLISFIFAIVLIIVNIIHAIRKRKLTNYHSSNIGLVVSNIYLVFLLPFMIALLICLISYSDKALRTVITLAVLPLLTPIINLIYVYFYDKTYNVCLQQLFKCQCTNYESEDIEQPVTYQIVPNDGKNNQK